MATYDATTITRLPALRKDRLLFLTFNIRPGLINAGSGLAATESAKLGTLPAQFVFLSCTPVLRVALGSAGTIDFGTAADPDGFLDGGDMNGSVDTAVALAGTETLVAGTYFHAATDVEISVPPAGATLTAGEIDLVLVGFVVEDPIV